jgi:signal transduction histidine kinase
LPDTKQVAVVVGNSPIEKYWKEEIGIAAKPLTDRVRFKWYDGLSFEDILKDAAALPPASAIFWELMIVDASGAVHEEGTALSRLYAVANAPIFSYTDAFFGQEIVGGPHVPVIEAGQRVAETAFRILHGEKAGAIKVPPVGMGTPKYDWRELQRWGISEDRLPPGSDIHYRRPTPWERYRWQLAGIGSAAVLQGLIILWLLSERRRRLLSEARTRETLIELAKVDRMTRIGELSASIAHEVTQPLAGMVASANAGLRWLSAARPDIDNARRALTHIADAGHRANDVIRSVRANFKTSNQEKRSINLNSLISRTLVLIDAELRENAIEIETDLDKRLPPVMGDATQLQQVLLNLMANSIESMSSIGSLPRKLRLRSEVQSDEEVLISIEDTGKGFKPDDGDTIFRPLFTTKSEGMGLGLSICRSVIEGHGGRIWASSDGYSGAKFQFALPAAASQR